MADEQIETCAATDTWPWHPTNTLRYTDLLCERALVCERAAKGTCRGPGFNGSAVPSAGTINSHTKRALFVAAAESARHRFGARIKQGKMGEKNESA
jgi:hypothetical protein